MILKEHAVIETTIPPERLVNLEKRRETVQRRMLVARWSTNLLHRYSTNEEARERLASPENADHGDQHTELMFRFSQKFFQNVPVVEASEEDYKSSLNFVRPFSDSIMFHDLLQALATKPGHDAVGALYYFLSSSSLTARIKRDGNLYEDFLLQEQEALQAICALAKSGKKIFNNEEDNKLWLSFSGGKNAENLDDSRRMQFYYDVLNNLDLKSIDNSSQWKEISEYIGFLGVYLDSPEERIKATSMMLNHGNPQRLAEGTFFSFSIKEAIRLVKEELNVQDTAEIYNRFPQLKRYQTTIDLIERDKLEDVTLKTTGPDSDLLETWTKYFTAVDLFWTVYPGMISVVRTLITSSKRYSEMRPLVLTRRKHGKNSLIGLDDDFKERISLVNSSGQPKGSSDFPDDLSRVLAESHLPFEKLCPNVWFIEKIVNAYASRFDAFESFILAIILADKTNIVNAYKEYQNSDLALLQEKDPDRGERYSQSISAIKVRYQRELEIILETIKNKSEGVSRKERRVFRKRKKFYGKGTHFVFEKIVDGIPKNQQSITYNRVADLLKLARKSIKDRYKKILGGLPSATDDFLQNLGYDTELDNLPFLYIPEII